ncbi:neuronal acetylcholine receptor subunit alpha-3-like [Mizuhopecten yessoensis]|uniref:Neuronal acetylcholine receptor subunit alpha-3 n=1 Tax=Mizuhopecten yessoensis TaxID=6573 RepID=A0A210PMV2_MIZYE|nr:neuronal acetylcholine receptor subunit alpha-3-like [Mizuhopecten yessoensis]OWF37794.1 Neuronal acetylcholine receptor subunit alpha-3 [Mizuhopecten yessoensis]
MVNRHTLQVLLALVSMVHATVAQTGDDLKTLHDELFITRSYRNVVPPYKNLNQSIIVLVAFFLKGINQLDEVEEKLATTAYLELAWNDAFLSWNKKDFHDISYFYVPQNAVWKPDISLQNGFTKLKELGDDVILVKVSYRGRIYWKPFEVFETKCDIDITNFPFDHQNCKLIFRMWTSQPQDVKFALKNPALNTQLYEPNGVWELTSTKIELTYGDVVVSLILHRRPEFYLLTLICPIILLSVLAIFTFVIPVNSGEKMGYSMTVHLAFAVFLTIVSTSLPVNSRTTAYLAVYLISLLVKGSAIVILTAAQVRLHHREDNLPPSLRRVIKIRRKLSILSLRRVQPATENENTETSSNSEKTENSVHSCPNLIDAEKYSDISFPPDASNKYEDDETECFTWADFSKALDFFFFCFFSIVSVILAIVYFTAVL